MSIFLVALAHFDSHSKANLVESEMQLPAETELCTLLKKTLKSNLKKKKTNHFRPYSFA